MKNEGQNVLYSLTHFWLFGEYGLGYYSRQLSYT